MNEYVKNKLEEYIQLNNPQYAIMLSGTWGVGKTFFIDNFIKNYQDNKKIIKISLFGLKTNDEISNQIFYKIINETPKAQLKKYTNKIFSNKIIF
jgi:predicted AAA+ superfamily ATPase